MAEDSVAQGKPLEELEKEITCVVCKGIYQQAKLLPCNHCYCTSCIEKLAAQSEGEPFECPECLKKTSLPQSGLNGLQPALFVERMKDMYHKMAKAEGRVEAVCEQCSSAKSVAFCRQCADFICDDCVVIHEKLKAFASHVVVSFEDLKKGGIQSLPLNDPPPGKCAEHDKSFKIFCFDCDRLICRDCTVIDHSGHKFDFLTKCAAESRNSLRETLAPLQNIQTEIETAEKALESEEAKVNRQKENACLAIQQSFEHLKTLLEERKVVLMEKASLLAQEKKDVLVAQKKELRVAHKDIQTLVEFVEKNIESTSNHDLISIRTQLQRKMEEEKERHQKLPLELKATADLSWHLPSPDIIPKDVGCVYNQSSPPTLFNINSFEKGSTVHVLLSAPTASLKDVTASLSCVANPSSLIVNGEVAQVCAGVFRISFTPRERGRHDLVVKVQGKHIAGSPLRVFVELPPHLLQKQFPRLISNHTTPWGVAINSKNQLVVAEIHGKRVEVVDKSGKVVQTFEDYRFRDACGVTTASDGTIYVADAYARRLFEINTNGKIYNSERYSWMPYGIKMIGNELYVTDYENHAVKVFDKDFHFVGIIETKEVPRTSDVTKGPDSLLYVAGEETIGVYKCEPNGVFIRHLNFTPSSLKLSRFHGICFDANGHIIATNSGNGVYVFRMDGECIGHINFTDLSASGVTVDEDGFMYVCTAMHNGKVSVF